METAYTVDRNEITGHWQVCHGAEKVTTCVTEAEAQHTAALMNSAWLRGKRHAQKAAREALGIREFADGAMTAIR